MNQLKKIAKKGFAPLTILSALTLGVMILGACSNPSGNDEIAVTGVSLNRTTLSLDVGATETITATVAPADATNKGVSWTSGDTAIATVSATGVVTGVSGGTATITVITADGGKTATCTVTVFSIQSIHIINGVSVPFRYVPAGSFQRDSTAANVSVITSGYWMSETEVTQGLFQAVMNIRSSYFTTNPEDESEDGWKKLPTDCVNWYRAIAFCNKLSLANGKEPVYSVSGVSNWATLTFGEIPTLNTPEWNSATWDKSKNGYRLPTEMEWMWAAMGADTSVQPNTTGYLKAFAGSTGSNSIGDYAWDNTNSDGKTHEVGKKLPNELGLKDMSGNVDEWCWDWYRNSYPAGEMTDYDGGGSSGGGSSAFRPFRGGCWDHGASLCAVSCRNPGITDVLDNGFGFRVVCP
jgi:formylglycine-generating enzyme required for sulfatase activity